MFQRFLNPTTIYVRRIQRGLEEARMAALEHESAAEHHAALAGMYRDRIRRLQKELVEIHKESEQPESMEHEDPAAAQVHRIMPRTNPGKRDESAVVTANNPSFAPQGAAG